MGKEPLGWIERVRVFLVGSREELRRVTWPSQRELYATTVVVIAFTLVMVAYIGVLEVLLEWRRRWLWRHVGG